MGHYLSEMSDGPTPEQIARERDAESFRTRLQENFRGVISARNIDVMECNSCRALVVGNYMDVGAMRGHLEWHATQSQGSPAVEPEQ